MAFACGEFRDFASHFTDFLQSHKREKFIRKIGAVFKSANANSNFLTNTSSKTPPDI